MKKLYFLVFAITYSVSALSTDYVLRTGLAKPNSWYINEHVNYVNRKPVSEWVTFVQEKKDRHTIFGMSYKDKYKQYLLYLYSEGGILDKSDKAVYITVDDGSKVALPIVFSEIDERENEVTTHFFYANEKLLTSFLKGKNVSVYYRSYGGKESDIKSNFTLAGFYDVIEQVRIHRPEDAKRLKLKPFGRIPDWIASSPETISKYYPQVDFEANKLNNQLYNKCLEISRIYSINIRRSSDEYDGEKFKKEASLSKKRYNEYCSSMTPLRP